MSFAAAVRPCGRSVCVHAFRGVFVFWVVFIIAGCFGGLGQDSGRFGAWESLQATDPAAACREALACAAGSVASRSWRPCARGLPFAPDLHVVGEFWAAFSPFWGPISAQGPRIKLQLARQLCPMREEPSCKDPCDWQKSALKKNKNSTKCEN